MSETLLELGDARLGTSNWNEVFAQRLPPPPGLSSAWSEIYRNLPPPTLAGYSPAMASSWSDISRFGSRLAAPWNEIYTLGDPWGSMFRWTERRVKLGLAPQREWKNYLQMAGDMIQSRFALPSRPGGDDRIDMNMGATSLAGFFDTIGDFVNKAAGIVKANPGLTSAAADLVGGTNLMVKLGLAVPPAVKATAAAAAPTVPAAALAKSQAELDLAAKNAGLGGLLARLTATDVLVYGGLTAAGLSAVGFALYLLTRSPRPLAKR